MKKLYSTTMINTGGRAGTVSSPDGSFSLKVAPPGSHTSGATDPEQLFAAAFSSCFNGALAAVLSKEKIRAASTLKATVTLYEKDTLDYVLGVDIEGHIDGLDSKQTEELLQKAHKVCPYSKATQGNIEVSIKAV